MNKQEALDFIDAYGTDKTRWPKGVAKDINALCKSDKEFKAHFNEQAELDAMLANWEENDDGAEIEQPDTKNEGLDDDQEPEDGDSDNSTGSAGASAERKERSFDWDLKAEDFENIKDTDETLAEVINTGIKDAIKGKYYVFSTQYDQVYTIASKTNAKDRFGNAKKITTEILDQTVREATGVLQKNIRRLIAARSRSIHTPGFRSGKLHGAALHRITTGDDRLFRRKQEAVTVDTAITMLIDCSGSMDTKVSSNKSRIDIAIESAYAMAQVLSKVGVDFEVIGFTNNHSVAPYCESPEVFKEYEKELDALVKSGITVSRYYPLIFPIFKSFNESFTPSVAQRFACAQADTSGQLKMMANTDGESLRYAARRLAAQQVERRIMIVLSDGLPAAYPAMVAPGDDYREAQTLLEGDLVIAVQEITKSGIEVLGIGMGYEGVRDYYPNAEVINNVSALPKVLMGQLSRMLVG